MKIGIANDHVAYHLKLVIVEHLRSTGHDVVDLSVTKRLTRWAELNFAIDNLLNKKYFETQNYFESRILAGEKSPVGERIHATPGYPFTASVGVTFRFGRR